VAVDIARAGRFGYDEPAVWFDGDTLPFASASVDHVLCTEVLEHVERPDQFVEELHRVLKPGGAALVTVPWSARYHYVPWDFHRFTPARLQTLFAPFSGILITPRGTDLTVIASKLIVAYARLCRSARTGGIGAALLAVALSPLIAASVLFGHITLKLSLGSADDPLGYTILASKAGAAPVQVIPQDAGHRT
jgi:SAM-dependent methyltransferase